MNIHKGGEVLVSERQVLNNYYSTALDGMSPLNSNSNNLFYPQPS